MVVAACTAIVLVLLTLVRSRPAWWVNIDAEDAQTRMAAEVFEQAVNEQLRLIRPSAPGVAATDARWRSDEWSVSLSEADVNAWLNTRLPKWLASQGENAIWPPDMTEVQISFADGEIRVGARVRSPGGTQIIAAALEPALDETGSLWLKARRVSVGRLDLPASWVLEENQNGEALSQLPASVATRPETEQMLTAFNGTRPVVPNSVVKLGDGRQVRLLKLAARDGRLEITCRTEKR